MAPSKATDLPHKARFARLALVLAIWWCVLWPQLASAEAGSRLPVVRLTASQTHLAFDGRHTSGLQRWVDVTGQASWAQAQREAAAGHFAPAKCPHCGGFTADAQWYVMRVNRAELAPSRWLLAVGAPYLNDVQVWEQGPTGELRRHVQMGDRFLQAGRPMGTRVHAMPIELPQNADTTLWIRVHSTSAMRVSIEMWQPDAFWQEEMLTGWVWGLVLGLMGLSIVTNLLFGMWLRDRVMAYYGAFVAALLVMWSGVSGMVLVLFAKPPWWLSDLVTGGGTLISMGVGNLFTLQALEMSRRFPRSAWWLRAQALVAFFAVPIAVTDGYRDLKSVFDLSVFFSECLTLWVAFALWRTTRERLHLVYLVAAAFYAAGAWVAMLTLTGLGAGQAWVGQIFAASNVLYLFIMLIAMGMRVSRLRTERLVAVERAGEQRRFVAMLTHEFRNPLASIDRSANLLQSVAGLSPEQIAARLAAIRQQAHRLNTLVDGFLTSDADASRLRHPRLTPCQVADFLMDVRQTLDEHSRARLVVEMPPGGMRAVFDPTLLRLALHNLIDNALRYSPEERVVEVRAGPLEPSDGWIISVRDHGPGLSAEELQRIGLPYFRGAASAGKQGSGLGYHFCRQIAEAHGGTIEAHNAVPHGLEVSLTLPRLEDKPAASLARR